jgi:hypothetical protein
VEQAIVHEVAILSGRTLTHGKLMLISDLPSKLSPTLAASLWGILGLDAFAFVESAKVDIEHLP